MKADSVLTITALGRTPYPDLEHLFETLSFLSLGMCDFVQKLEEVAVPHFRLSRTGMFVCSTVLIIELCLGPHLILLCDWQYLIIINNEALILHF